MWYLLTILQVRQLVVIPVAFLTCKWIWFNKSLVTSGVVKGDLGTSNVQTPLAWSRSFRSWRDTIPNGSPERGLLQAMHGCHGFWPIWFGKCLPGSNWKAIWQATWLRIAETWEFLSGLRLGQHGFMLHWPQGLSWWRAFYKGLVEAYRLEVEFTDDPTPKTTFFLASLRIRWIVWLSPERSWKCLVVRCLFAGRFPLQDSNQMKVSTVKMTGTRFGRFPQLQVAFGLMQSAMLLTGLERSIQNTRGSATISACDWRFAWTPWTPMDTQVSTWAPVWEWAPVPSFPAWALLLHDWHDATPRQVG